MAKPQAKNEGPSVGSRKPMKLRLSPAPPPPPPYDNAAFLITGGWWGVSQLNTKCCRQSYKETYTENCMRMSVLYLNLKKKTRKNPMLRSASENFFLPFILKFKMEVLVLCSRKRQ